MIHSFNSVRRFAQVPDIYSLSLEIQLLKACSFKIGREAWISTWKKSG